MSNYEEHVVIEMEELFEYVNKKTGINMDIVISVLESEMNYLTSRGIASDNTGVEFEEEKPFVDDNELVAYIMKDTNIAEETIEVILDGEMEFLDSKGLIEYEGLD